MRTRTTTERNLIKAARVNHHIWVEVENVDRAWIDISAYVESAEWGEDVSSSTWTFSLGLRRDSTAPTQTSLAPLIGASTLNRDGAGAYAPLLDAGRNVRIYHAVVAAGATPVAGDKKLGFVGRIDSVGWATPTVRVSGRDSMGWVVEAAIQTEVAYATSGPTPVETVMAQVLANTPVYGAPTLYTPTSPGWMLNNTAGTKQARKPVAEALQQDYAASIGWMCRYRFDASDAFRLTFYEPDRDNVTVHDQFDASEYEDITDFEVTDEDVRNLIVGKYVVGGTTFTRTVSNSASQSKYGVKFMEIALAEGDPIDSDVEMDTYLNAAASDLGSPYATHTMKTLFYWPVQLHDRYNFVANGDHYDSDQVLSVVGYRHRFENGEAWTTITCSGHVVGAYRSYFMRGATGDAASTTAASTSLSSLNDLKWTDSSDGTTRTYTWTRGASVQSVWVHDRLRASPVTGDPWPTATDLPDSVLLTDDFYVARKPLSGFERFIQLEPRLAGLGFGPVRRLTLQPAMPLVALKLTGLVTLDLADLTVSIAGAKSIYPATWSLYEDDPDAAPLATATVSADTTYTKATAGFSVLGNRVLPLREVRRWFLKLDYQGAPAPVWAFYSADRDALASGAFTPADFRANAGGSVTYDDDTDSVRVTVPGGKTKTWTGLVGDGTTSYAAGSTLLDDSTTETALKVDETRGTYLVELYGGGKWVKVFEGALHGPPSNPPTVLPRTVLNANRDAADVYGIVQSPVNEQLRLWVRDGELDTAPIYGLVVGAGDSSALYVAPGTEVGPSHFFHDGTGSPVAVLSGRPLGRDQVRKVYLQAQGKDSQVRGPWTPVTLSIKEKPWLESVSATFDPASGNLRVRMRGGAHCASAFVEVASSSSFVGAITAAVTLADLAEVTQTFALSGAQRGKTWYVRVTPYNGPLVAGSPSGLDGGPSIAETYVPSAYKADVSVSETESQGTLTVVVDDPGTVLDGASRVKAYIRTGAGARTLTLPTTAPSGTTTSGTYTFTFNLGPHTTVVEPVVYLASGIQELLGSATFDVNKVPDCINLSVAYVGSTAHLTAVWDTDAASGAGNFEYRVDGGAWISTVAMPASLVVSWTLAMSTVAKQLVEVRAKNASGSYSTTPYASVEVSRYDATSTGPSLNVVATPGSSTYSVSYSATGTITYKVDGATTTLPASPFSVFRPSAGSTPKSLSFSCTQNGQTVTEEVTIPAIDADTDTVTPDVQLNDAGRSATTQSFSAYATNPKTSANLSATFYFDGCSGSVGGNAVSAGGSWTLTPGSSGVSVVANRPAIGSPPGTIRMVSTVAGGGTASISRTVSEQTKDFTPPSFEPYLTQSGTNYVGNFAAPAAGIWIYGKTDNGLWTILYDGSAWFNTTYSVAQNAAGGAPKTMYLKAVNTSTGLETLRAFTVPPQDATGGTNFVFSSVSVVVSSYSSNTLQVSWSGTGTIPSGATFDVYRDGLYETSSSASPVTINAGSNIEPAGTSGASPIAIDVRVELSSGDGVVAISKTKTLNTYYIP